MMHEINIVESPEGWAASCPELPGCHSQGSTREEAMKNINVAIREWLEVEAEDRGQRASHAKFEKALAQVPNVPPVPGDEL